MAKNAYDTVKESAAVKSLKEDYKNKFIQLVDQFGPQLDNGPALKEIGFTPHNFSNHVKDIILLYKKMLPNSFFKKTNEDSIFILLVATLFHDYAMVIEWNETVREKHATKGRELFLKFFDEGIEENNLVKACVPEEYKEWIGDIIFAHSDEKENGVKLFNSFDKICDKYESLEVSCVGENTGKPVDIPFLAALLRLADELDISHNRIEGVPINISNNIDSSLSHFKLCKLILKVTPSDDNNSIVIVPDKGKCKLDVLKKSSATDEEVCEAASNAALILERYEKIKREFEVLSNRALRNTAHSKIENWGYVDISLLYMDELLEAVKKKRQVMSTSSEITDLVLDNSLFLSGHFRLENDGVNVRDWINLERLFNDEKDSFFTILEQPKNETEMMLHGKDVIIGVNRYGSFLAARWGFMYSIPFSYFFEDKEIVDSLEHNLYIKDAKKILLIVDVVVFGKSVEKVVNKIKAKFPESVIEVLVLFERFFRRRRMIKRHINGYYYSAIYSNENIRKIYVANDEFDIEICKKNSNECPFSKESNCDSCDNDIIFEYEDPWDL